jgi:hypothetical protein
MSGRAWVGRRTALVAVDAFTALTAIGGGAALAGGMEGDRFPASWLDGTPFRSYVAPGLLLAGVVGGTAAVATIATVRQPVIGGRISMIAGGVLAAWIVGEVAILSKDGEVVSPTEAVYLAAAAAMIALGGSVARTR